MRSPYPSQKNATPVMTRIFVWYSKGRSPARGASPVPRASKSPANRGNTFARKVAIPKNTPQRINKGPDIFHRRGRAPNSTGVLMLWNIPNIPSTNAGVCPARRGKRNASIKLKQSTRANHTLRNTNPRKPSHPVSLLCLI